jgi:hypothetical protein
MANVLSGSSLTPTYEKKKNTPIIPHATLESDRTTLFIILKAVLAKELDFGKVAIRILYTYFQLSLLLCDIASCLYVFTRYMFGMRMTPAGVFAAIHT